MVVGWFLAVISARERIVLKHEVGSGCAFLLNTASHLSNYISHNDTVRNVSKRLSQLRGGTSGSLFDRISHSPFKYDPECPKKTSWSSPPITIGYINIALRIYKVQQFVHPHTLYPSIDNFRMTNAWNNPHHQQDVGYLMQHVSCGTSFCSLPHRFRLRQDNSSAAGPGANHSSTECGQYHSGLPLSNLFNGRIQPSN